MRVGTLGRTVLLGLLLLGVGGMEVQAQAQWSIGGGVHYLRNIGDITKSTGGDDLGFSRNSFGLVGSGRGNFGLFKVEGQVEYIFDFAGTDKGLWQPSLWGLVGGLVYGGAGIGWSYHDGDWFDDPWYALRAGVDVPLGGLELDVYAAWEFQNSQDFKDLTGEDLDRITFSALLRFVL